MSEREAGGDGQEPVVPEQRRQDLPWQTPKEVEDDPEALRRVGMLLASPGYKMADRDVDFIARDELRSTRLALDYLKPEISFIDHGVRHTIVVFGSSRIPEPAAAERHVARRREELAANPGDPALERAVRIAERQLARSDYYTAAREFGRLVGNAGEGPGDTRIVMMTGGGPGIMEASNRGSYEIGAKSIGLNIALPHEQFPNPYITPDLCLRFHYFALRKLHFLHRAKALVAFPGGYGTLDELFETLTLVQTRKIRPLPIVLVGEEFWSRAVDFEFLVDEGVIDPEDIELFRFADTAEEAWGHITAWYECNGEALLEDVQTRREY